MPKNCAAIVIAAKHGELIKVKDYSGITNTVGALRCRFEFRTSDWDNATMTAVFCKGNMATHPEIVDNAIGVLLDGDDECAVPAEVLTRDAKYFSVGVWGITATGLRIVSKWLVFRIEDGCYVDATEPIEPTPTVYEQIMLTLQSKASVDHKHDDIYYTKEEIDDIKSDVNESFKQVVANTEARHIHSNKNTIDKFSEDSDGNPLYNGKKIVADVDFKEIDPTVPTWAKQPNKPSYTADEVGALSKNTVIPTKVSQLENNLEFVTSSELENKQDKLTEYVVTINGKSGEVILSSEDIGADSKGTASTKIAEHNVDKQVHQDIRLLIIDLSERINAIADSDDTTLDQLSEIVAYIKSNKTLIDAITTEKISYTDIINNLETNISNKPLSAAMGVTLKNLIDAIVMPSKLSELINDSGFITEDDLPEVKDGYSPIVDVEEIDGGHKVTITDIDNEKTINIMDGADGYTPQKGVDYFTEADKLELVTDVLNTLPTWQGGEY